VEKDYWIMHALWGLQQQVDNQIPMLLKMAEKRLKGYSKIGYVTE
jgi:hypothetical protein